MYRDMYGYRFTPPPIPPGGLSTTAVDLCFSLGVFGTPPPLFHGSWVSIRYVITLHPEASAV